MLYTMIIIGQAKRASPIDELNKKKKTVPMYMYVYVCTCMYMYLPMYVQSDTNLTNDPLQYGRVQTWAHFACNTLNTVLQTHKSL